MIEFPAVPRVLQVPGSSYCCFPRVCGSSTFDPGVNAGGSASPAVPGSPCARGVLYSCKTLGLDWNVGTGTGRFGSLISFPCLSLDRFFCLYGHQVLKVCWKSTDVCWNGLQLLLVLPLSSISFGVSAIMEQTLPLILLDGVILITNNPFQAYFGL